MKKKYLVLNASLFVLIITVGIIFSIDRNLLTKSIASILFVILGITNLILISKEKSSNKFA